MNLEMGSLRSLNLIKFVVNLVVVLALVALGYLLRMYGLQLGAGFWSLMVVVVFVGLAMWANMHFAAESKFLAALLAIALIVLGAAVLTWFFVNTPIAAIAGSLAGVGVIVLIALAALLFTAEWSLTTTTESDEDEVVVVTDAPAPQPTRARRPRKSTTTSG